MIGRHHLNNMKIFVPREEQQELGEGWNRMAWRSLFVVTTSVTSKLMFSGEFHLPSTSSLAHSGPPLSIGKGKQAHWHWKYRGNGMKER